MSEKKQTLPQHISATLYEKRRWFFVGMGVKRWLLVLAVGSGMLGMGVVYSLMWLRTVGLLRSTAVYQFLTLQWMPMWLAMLLPLLTGGTLITVALWRMGINVTAPFRRPDVSISEAVYHYQRRNKGPKIVAIGGGTGLSTLLRGLSKYTRNVTAIVTVADDGGSSGRLREEFGILPPGDFRNNIAALSRDEALMTQLLQYRFGRQTINGRESDLGGHAFGNLLIAALVGLTGSFEEALLAAQRVLAVRGRVLPSTLTPVALVADMEVDGRLKRVVGESAIPKAGGRIKRLRLEPEQARAYPEAIQAILKADLVVIGPGSLYTSILPNLLVPGIGGALSRTRAKRVYVCNLATQKGETDRFSVPDHVAALVDHIDSDCFDMVLANDNLDVDLGAAAESIMLVPPTAPDTHALHTADLINEQKPGRHDSMKLAAAVVRLLDSS